METNETKSKLLKVVQKVAGWGQIPKTLFGHVQNKSTVSKRISTRGRVAESSANCNTAAANTSFGDKAKKTKNKESEKKAFPQKH